MKRSHQIAIVFMILVGLWVLSAILFPADDKPETEGEQAADGQFNIENAIEIKAMAAQSHRRQVMLYGATAPNRRVELKAETQGTITKIPATEGAPLKEGSVIVEIDERDRRVRYAQAKALLDQREIQYNAARRLEAEGFQTEIRLAEAKTQLEEARVNLRQIELDLKYTKLRSPFDGILEKVNVEVGDFVGVGVFGGEGALATVVDLDPLLIVGQIAERDRSAITVGDKASGRLADSNQKLEGDITYISSVADQESRTFRVEISAPNPERRIPAGVTAELALPAAQIQAHRITPAVLALDDTGKVGVKVVNRQYQVQFVPIEIVEDTKEGMWISGLPETVWLITKGQGFVSHGQQLEPEAVQRMVSGGESG